MFNHGSRFVGEDDVSVIGNYFTDARVNLGAEPAATPSLFCRRRKAWGGVEKGWETDIRDARGAGHRLWRPDDRRWS